MNYYLLCSLWSTFTYGKSPCYSWAQRTLAMASSLQTVNVTRGYHLLLVYELMVILGRLSRKFDAACETIGRPIMVGGHGSSWMII